MNTPKLLTQYGEFIEKQTEEKNSYKKEMMISIIEDITSEMSKKGWIRKGKGQITDVMSKGNSFSIEYTKVYNSKTVQVIIRINVGDDYIHSYRPGSWTQFLIKNCDKKSFHWWNRGKDMGCPIQFDVEETHDFHLKKILETVDEFFS